MRHVRFLAMALGTAAALAACDDPISDTQATESASEAAKSTDLDAIFARAGSEFGVPTELLKAVSFAETRWQFVKGESGDMGSAAYGLFALRGEQLEKAAKLARVSLEAAKTQPEANVRAGAALLRAEADALGIRGSDLSAWAPAVAQFKGATNPAVQASFVHSGVYRALRQGIRDSDRATLAARPGVQAQFQREAATGPSLTAQYGPAIWSPAPASNFTQGHLGYNLSLVVIHTCAGEYSGCWGWLTTPYPRNPYQTSAHYVISEHNGEVRQLVDEANTAHHVGAYFNGLPVNPRSIGIEHGGFSYTATNKWPEIQMKASWRLTCDIVKSHGIIRDRQHIIGHYQADPANRANDPGTSFPWAVYMDSVNACATGIQPIAPGAAITIDSNNGRNNAAIARVAAPSAAWMGSAGTAGFHGTGYYFANTGAVSDPLAFEFYLPAPATKQVHAWWTAGSNRASAAPYIAFDAAGNKVGVAYANQQLNGGKWNLLGTYQFSAGWNSVKLSRWTTSGDVVIGDAVQIR